jgi:hypothetical protein
MSKISCQAPFKGEFFGIFKILSSTLLHLLPTVSEDAGIEPRTVCDFVIGSYTTCFNANGGKFMWCVSLRSSVSIVWFGWLYVKCPLHSSSLKVN